MLFTYPSLLYTYLLSSSCCLQHLHDLNAVYNKYKLRHNVFVSHCYGAIHTLRLLDLIYSKEKTIEDIVAVVLFDLGANAPVSLGLVGKLPAFVLGEWYIYSHVRCCRPMYYI